MKHQLEITHFPNRKKARERYSAQVINPDDNCARYVGVHGKTELEAIGRLVSRYPSIFSCDVVEIQPSEYALNET